VDKYSVVHTRIVLVNESVFILLGFLLWRGIRNLGGDTEKLVQDSRFTNICSDIDLSFKAVMSDEFCN